MPSNYEQWTGNLYAYYHGDGAASGKISRTLAGHDVIIMLAGKYVGRAQSLTASRDFGTEAVYELGSMKPQEFIHLRYSGTGTLTRYLIRESDLVEAIKATGVPNYSYSNEAGLLLQAITGLDIMVVDKYATVADKIIRMYMNCVINSTDENFSQGAISGETANFLYSECKTRAEMTGAEIGQAASIIGALMSDNITNEMVV